MSQFQKVIQYKTGLRSDNQYSLLNFMLMNELSRERLIRLLSESTQVTNEEIQNAYGCFMKRVKTVSQSEKDYSEIYRTLKITRIELVSIELLYRYEQGKKRPKVNLFTKGIGTYQC